MLAPIPFTIITGFLGSGKTTLLNHLLQQPALAGCAVIVNEFGEIGIDHLLVRAPAENMVLLDTGCLCCTVRGELVGTLSDMHAKRAAGMIPPFNHVIVETTGLADPVPVLQSIVADEALKERYRLQDVVTLVDAVHGRDQLARHPESVKQAAVADALVITKTDLASAAQVTTVLSKLRAINPGADLHRVIGGRIDPHVLLRGGLYDRRSGAEGLEHWLRTDDFERATQTGNHAHGDVRHDERIHAFCVYHERPVRRAGLMMWLDMLAGLRGANLLRVKGILNVEEEPVVVHAVQTIVHEPVVLEAWPSADRRSRLVFITRGMTRGEVERTLEAFDFTPPPRQSALDPRAYARFLDAMKGFR
jgi:G3E family GTPase